MPQLQVIKNDIVAASGKVVGVQIVHPHHGKNAREILKQHMPNHHEHVLVKDGRIRVLKFEPKGSLSADERTELFKQGDPNKLTMFHITGDLAHLAGFHEDQLPEEILEVSNLFLNSGINEQWDLLTGTHTNLWTNANSEIGVGDSSTSAVATQTDLQASVNKAYQACDSTYPQIPGSQNILFQATLGSSAANFAWNEMVAKNSASSVCYDRAVASLGTKASSTSWVAQLTLSES